MQKTLSTGMNWHEQPPNQLQVLQSSSPSPSSSSPSSSSPSSMLNNIIINKPNLHLIKIKQVIFLKVLHCCVLIIQIMYNTFMMAKLVSSIKISSSSKSSKSSTAWYHFQHLQQLVKTCSSLIVKDVTRIPFSAFALRFQPSLVREAQLNKQISRVSVSSS